MIKVNHFYCITILITVLSVSACSKSEVPTSKTIKDSQFVFGTIVDVTIYSDKNINTTKALQSITHDLKHLHKSWHPWDIWAMGRANRLISTTEWFSYNPSIHTLLVDGQKYSLMSQGLFNPTLGNYTKLWGFHSEETTLTEPPPTEQIKKLLAQAPSMNDISINGIRIKSINPNIVFDFGAMAKGLAVDMALTRLKDFNIHNAMINAGGDIKVIGQHGDRPWHIGIRHPRKKDSVLAGVDLHSNESIFTSGDYERYFMHEGIRYHHILDPRTGYPATKSMSVTVIHPDAALADAAATALFVAGPEKWHEIAKSMGIKFVLLVDAKGNIHMNPAMQKRINLLDAPKNITISDPL